MNSTAIEKRIKTALDNSVPDVLDSILAECDRESGNNQEERGAVIMLKNKKSKSKLIAVFGAAAAAVVVAVSGITIYSQNYMVDSTIGFDVNPSIELKTNRSDRVISAEALNDDANVILEGMDLNSADINTAVNAIIGSMLKNGYIDDLANSILVSVENNDQEKGEKLRLQISEEIDNLLSSAALKPSVVSQTVVEDDDINSIAEKYNISIGKAKLIKSVSEKNSALTLDKLAPLTINEINLLAGEDISGVEITGNASNKAYIGDNKAKEIALNDAGVKNPDYIAVEFDADDGVMVYDVEFRNGAVEYDYEIDALNGFIIKSEKDSDDDYKANTGNNNNNQNNNNGSLISRTRARNIALDHAGVKNPDYINIKLDYDDGIRKYEIDFRKGAYEYDYDINAENGNIIKSESDRDDDYNDNDDDRNNNNNNNNQNSNNNGSLISKTRARNIALNHAGVKNPDYINIKLDYDDGMRKYEIDFRKGAYEYDYDINAENGNIIKSDRDRDDDYNDNDDDDDDDDYRRASSKSSNAYIGKTKAQNIAKKAAGVSSVRYIKCEFDEDDGRYVYEIEFEDNNFEYSYEINAKTGAVISSDKEHIDDDD